MIQLILNICSVLDVIASAGEMRRTPANRTEEPQLKSFRVLVLLVIIVAIAAVSSSSIPTSAAAPGKSVVLVHGLYGNPWAFAWMQYDLEARGYTVR